MSTKRLFISSSFIPQLRGVNLVPPSFKSWSEASDEEVAEYLQKHYAGEINLHEIWNIGDTRTVHLSEIASTNDIQAFSEQDVEFQLVNAGGKELANGVECAFVVQVKDLLTTTYGRMRSNESNSGGWKECPIRTWCNDAFRDSFPDTIKSIFKLHKNKTSKGNRSTVLDETEDYYALPSGYNVDGSIGVGGYAEGEDSIQWTFYTNKENRLKRWKNGTSYYWWLRSPSLYDGKQFCMVDMKLYSYSESVVTNDYSNGWRGIAPFGTI